MRIPIEWLNKYINLEHNYREFGDIMTKLDTMQDGPIAEVNGLSVIDLEVRQNRSDLLSVLGNAREYAGYINKKVIYPKKFKKLNKIQETSDFLNVNNNSILRYFAVKIEGVKNIATPISIKNNLLAYGINSVNCIVDITNYVMLEYGIPLHSYDFDILNNVKPKNGLKHLFNFRTAKPNEIFTTWQNKVLNLTNNDVVITDKAGNIHTLAGLMGDARTGTNLKTKNILLQAANYDQPTIRKVMDRHKLFNDTGLRHSKLLSTYTVNIALKRAIYLILKHCGGNVTLKQDYYPPENIQKSVSLDLDITNIKRLSGINLTINKSRNYLQRFGFEVEKKSKNILNVVSPMWRTDIEQEEDLIEEILRLHGYEKIKLEEIPKASPIDITPVSYKIERKIRDLLISLGLDEQITTPVVKSNLIDKTQVILQNSITENANALRTNLIDNLKEVINEHLKINKNIKGIFEIGKIYKNNYSVDVKTELSLNSYKEIRQISALYSNKIDFHSVKSDFRFLIDRLGLDYYKLKEKNYNIGDLFLNYSYNDEVIFTVYNNGFTLYTDNLINIVDVEKIPNQKLILGFPQIIEEEMSFILYKDRSTTEVIRAIKDANNSITEVFFKEEYLGKGVENGYKSMTFTLIMESAENKLSRQEIEKIRKYIINSVENKKLAKFRY